VSGAPYVELRCKSAFSFLEGASLPEDLIAAAAATGHTALALADRNGVYGAPRFFRAARATGIRPIVGAEVALADGPPLLLLVEDRRGYQNLCRLLTLAKADRPKGEGRATAAQIAEHAAGLVALAGPTARDDLPALREVFGAERLYVEAQRHLDDEEAHRNRKALAQARSLGLPIVATNDVRYASPAGQRTQDVLTALRLGCTIDAAGRRLLRNAERHLKPPAELARLFRDLPAALHATRAIAERCAFTLADLGYGFPRFPTLPGQTEQGLLEQLTWAGAARRYDPLDRHERARRQIEHELNIIGRLGLAGYFLVVWDIVEYARRRGILVQGRGSAANSATCYSLGITAVDPVGMELLFERFLSEERVRTAPSAADRVPDIDLDLPSGERREDVIQHVYRKYGPRGAGMTANVITYRPRMAVRDAGRALGFSEEQLGRIAKHLPHWIHEDDKPLGAFLAEAGFPDTEARTRHLADVATRLLNLPRHLGQHSGGMVICGGRLDEIVPLEPASMPGRTVVEWDKDDCADLGIVKVDLLGLGMLAALEDAVPLIAAHEGVAIDYAHLPPDDPAVYAMLRAADTVGVFQVESRAQMATLPRMQPERFYDLVVEVAIIRPGPIVGKMVNPYLLRRQGRETITYPHPSLEPILKRTLGVPLFQEQLIRMAMVASGFTGGQAEELRRAMGFKRSVERMKQIEHDLRAGMTRNGITGEAQEQIVQGIRSFALYGFPESHAASFALIAYASAYLKAHHGAAFLCALLNNYPMGFYHPATLVSDAQRHGIEVRPVDVTRSDWLCTLERDKHEQHHRHDPGQPLAVRVGLRYVAGLREVVGRAIPRQRRHAPFRSIADLHARVAPNDAELARLAEAGAFATLGGSRRAALWQVEALGKSGALFAHASAKKRTHANTSDEANSPLPDMSPTEEVFADLRGTGLTTGPHPIAPLRPRLARLGVTPAAGLASLGDGGRARIGGVVIVRQRPGSAKGIVFITLEDETGFANAVVYADRFERFRRVIVGQPTLIIDGVVQNRDGVVTILADDFHALAPPAAELAVSHDFH
jgi:error-prone DNA polymerase